MEKRIIKWLKNLYAAIRFRKEDDNNPFLIF